MVITEQSFLFNDSQNESPIKLIVYNEDLEEDNSDWNDEEGEDDDEEIDSEGMPKKISSNVNQKLIFVHFCFISRRRR